MEQISSPKMRGALALVLAAGLAACAGSPAAPTNFAPFTQTDLKVGGGAAAVDGSVVTVAYTGWFYDASQPEQKGPQFDSSVGRAPFSFTLGSDQVIEGWNRGVVGMRVGGVRRLIIPPSLAYGDRRNGLIPPHATLLFEIELLAVE